MSNRERLIEIINSLNDNVVPVEQIRTFKFAAVAMIGDTDFDHSILNCLYAMYNEPGETRSWHIRNLAYRCYREFVS